jgi:signal transduction histidine kinase
VVTITIPAQATTFGPLGVLLGYGATGIVLVRKLHAFEEREQRAWGLIGIGFLVAATGITTVALIEIIGGTVPAFGPTDLFFIASYALIITGFASLPHLTTDWAARLRVYADSLIGALSVGAILWVVVLDDLLTEFAQASAWDRWAGSAYPVLDVAALMVVVLVTVRRSSYRFDPRLVFFALGIIAQSAADLRFLSTAVGKSFDEANPIFPLFLIATSLYLTAALIVDRTPKERTYADRNGRLLTMIAPYGAALVLVGILIYQTESAEIALTAQVVFFVSLTVIGLVILRQTVAIRENRRLVEDQRADLVSSISHELRTPLTAIVGFLDVMDDDGAVLGEAERAELTNVIHEQARHMSRIVSDLILLARGSPDDLTLRESRVKIADVVKGAVNSIEQKNGSLTVEVETQLQAMLDAGRVQQVIVNLLTNAVRYGDGKSLIVVRREGRDLAIEVHDNGPGVPKKYELMIWERFERGPNRFNSATPGSGIGLAVVDAITRAHHGSAAYRQSERLGGACFRVVLPDRVVAA